MSRIKVGYLGPGTNTFGYQALKKFFSKKDFKNIQAVDIKDHSEVCLAVGNMDVDYGVVAIENVIDGVVIETIRAIESVDSHLGLKIWGEVTLPIELFCMSKSGDKSLVKRLVSHEKALGQCSKFVSQFRARGVTIEAGESTARSAEITSNDPGVAALASMVALKSFGLKLIQEESVTDYKNSATRFWILGKKHARLEKGDSEKAVTKYKTCFLVNLEQTASGVLHKTLGVFANKGISVLLMYPNPISGKKWEYTFVLEVSGHVSEPRMIDAWEDFRELGVSLLPMRFLGSYPDTTSG